MSLQEDMRIVERTLQKLGDLDSIIKFYLKSKTSMELLKKKLKQFDKAIADLPDWCIGSWVDDWREKKRTYRERYEEILKPKIDEETTRARFENLVVDVRNDHAVGSSVRNCDDNGNSTLSNSRSSSASQIFSSYPKDSLQSQLCNAYVQLRSIDNSADHDGLKQLLLLMESSLKALENNESEGNNKDFENQLLRYSLRKLPANIRSKFLEQHTCHGQSLKKLFNWLGNILSDKKKRKHSSD